jgi:GntR family phosphonate transport system transcriptional regulator
VADSIEQAIADGTYARDTRLPGELEIAEIHRVNRHTVRRALATLAERGLVRAERGSGTYVEAPRLSYPLRSRTRFSEIVGAGGREPRGQLIAASEEPATRELARALGLKTGAPLVRIEALRLADKTPICVSTSWLSAEQFPDAGRIFAAARSMTALLAHYGVRDYRRGGTRITAAIADASDAARLELALGRPVLVVDSTDIDAEGMPLITKRSRFAAERVTFEVEG